MNNNSVSGSGDNIPPHVLEEILADGFNPKLLPPDVSMDFAMTPNNLFAVWTIPSARLRAISDQPPVVVKWVLATGDVMNQAQKAFKDSPVLAMMSLSDIRSLLDQMSSSVWFKKVPNVFKKVYFVQDQDSGQKKWSSFKSGSVLFEGDLGDLMKLANQGQKFVDTNNYREIFDVRPVQEGHPSDWVQFMRHPKTAMMLRQELREHGIE